VPDDRDVCGVNIFNCEQDIWLFGGVTTREEALEEIE
jgi:hypothetical protein